MQGGHCPGNQRKVRENKNGQGNVTEVEKERGKSGNFDRLC